VDPEGTLNIPIPPDQPDHEEPEINPDDSVSQLRSVTSSVASSRAKLHAKAAALKVEADVMKRRHELEAEEAVLRRKREEFELHTQLAVVTAQANVLGSVEQQQLQQVSVTSDVLPEPGSTLNPIAPEWRATQVTGFSDQPSRDDMVLARHHELLAAVHLPHTEIMYFDGNPLDYWSFVRSFQNTIESVCTDDVSKLTRLLQYCKGRAKQVIQCCVVMDPKEGFERAKGLLKERFGNNYVISEAWVNKVAKGKMISPHDKEALREFADDLVNCEITLTAMNCLQEVNSQRVLVEVVNRLPTYLKHRWIRRVREVRTNQERETNMRDLVSFVTGAAEEASDPVYSKLTSGKEKPHGEKNYGPLGVGKRQYFSGLINHDTALKVKGTTVHQNGILPACIVCSGAHTIFQCEQFRGLEPDERRKLAQGKGLCFNCLKGGHRAATCQLQRTCSVPGCSQKHTRFLHQAIRPATLRNVVSHDVGAAVHPGQDSISTDARNGFIDAEDRCMVTGAGSVKAALPLVPVKVRSQNGQYCVCTHALLDSGSTTTFCTMSLAQSLGLVGRRETLTLSTLGSSSNRIQTSVVNMIVSDFEEQSDVHLRAVYTKEELPISLTNAASEDEIRRWPHLQNIEICNVGSDRVDLLIGQDCPEALVPLEVRKGDESSTAPYAVRTVLGWTIQGPVRKSSQSVASVYFVRTDDELHQKLEKFWRLDYDEELISDEKGMSVEDRRAISVMEETISKVGEHYELAIPFKQRPVNLPNNRFLVEERLRSLGRRLSRDAALCKKYCDGMNDMVIKGYASRVEGEESNRDDGAVWYLPHHAVAKKGDKIRIVFDCAARFRGTSLNDQVMQGPNLTNTLVGVLLRFRQEHVAVMADIEAMFNQVMVAEQDRDVLRYLWWPNGDQSLQPEIYRMNVHLFGGTWSPSCCNFALRRVASDNKDSYSPDIVNTVMRNFYVDDCLKSVESEDKAVELAEGLTDLLRQGGLKLTKWVSTSSKVLESVGGAGRSQRVNIELNDDGYSPTERALGLSWNVEDDCFMFRMSPSKAPLTRRGLLSTMCSVYDPLGFVSPFTLVAKKLMQDLTRLKLGWDEPLPKRELSQWIRWCEDLAKLRLVRVPRCLKGDAQNDVHYQLHHFADASCAAYGAVTYLRVKGPSGKATCSLLMARSRLAPVKTVTLPRLELMAATLAVKIDQLMQRELDLPLTQSVFWSDSTIVLQYISNEHKRFHVFVSNRVATIRNSSSVQQWKHVNSRENAADDVSRGLTADELIRKQRWWKGPQFLTKSEDEWPKQYILNDLSCDDPEVKKDELDVDSFAVVNASEHQLNSVDSLLERRSSWTKLKADVAWILRFVAYLRSKRDTSVRVGPACLTVAELRTAETVIIRYIQRQSFPQEVKLLDAGNRQSMKSVKKQSTLYKLDPMMMPNGTVCVGGRLKYAPYISEEAKHPVILPKVHHVVDLIIRHEHEMNAHVGKEHVLSLLQQRYWIINGRSAVRRVLNNCVTCRRMAARRGEQKMANLPPDRITAEKPPFTFVGVDLFGPFVVKRGRSEMKRYGCLFTCLVIRAVHIEVVCSLDTDSFLNALQRFISRRGKPILIRSDNATNFKSGDRELRQAVQNWNNSQVEEYLQQREIEWKYNPPSASHMGGVWERLIRTVRRVLGPLLKEQVLDDEALNTVMCLAESIVNSRPLTPVSDDANDLEALTPNHLLTLRQEPVLPPGIFVRQDNYSRRRWKQVQHMTDIFWRRWTREYLPLLQQRSKWIAQTRDFKSGDIVLLLEDSPRNCWPLARILAVHQSEDGHVRSVTLKTRGVSSVVRPVSKICLLETTSDDLVQ